MIIKREIPLERFEAWSGAAKTLQIVIENDVVEDLENILMNLYPNGMTDTELNDLLWFDSEMVYEWLGIGFEGEIDDEN